MKKIVTIILTITMLLLPLNSATVNAIIPGEDAYQSDDLKIYEYEVATGNINVTTLGELRSTVDPSLLASAAPNGVAVSQGYTPEHLQNELPEMHPNVLRGSWFIIGTTTTERYRRTVRVVVRAPNGMYYTASGFMIGPSTVATAGHVLYNRTLYGGNGYAVSATITPAYNNGSAPYGNATASHFILNEGWTLENDSEYDWAVIRLNSNIGDNTGYMSIRYQSSSYNNTSVDIMGYPGEDEFGNDIDNRYMYRSSGTITSTEARRLYSNNTNVLGGVSGGPVQRYYTETGYTAIALVWGGNETTNNNIFIRITREVYDFFIAYKNTRV